MFLLPNGSSEVPVTTVRPTTVPYAADDADQSGADQLHLFMWVDLHNRWDVMRAFDEGDLTTAPGVDPEHHGRVADCAER
jgi:hypothetical protein